MFKGEDELPKGRILSGMQPTGKLHLGNLEGALRNWVQLQDEYEMFSVIVDWHSLTTAYEDTSDIKSNIRELTIDYMSAGLDPERCTIFVQSHVKEHAELHLLFSMLTPVPWLERVPTYKEKTQELKMESVNYGFLGYPVLQAADILIYKADTVPVGRDQLPHLELAREIARRFNSLYGEVFPLPQAKLTKFALLPGIDGRKMSKSYGNHICMADDPGDIKRKIKVMFTDPTKIYKGDPGHPDDCPVYAFHLVYSSDETAEIKANCESGALGCVNCKSRLSENLLEALAPIQARRREFESDPKKIDEILAEGANRARKVAQKTMEEVREAMHI